MANIKAGVLRGRALFLDGRLSALFFTAGVKTDREIGIGSTRAALIRAYGASHLIFIPARGSQASVHVYTKARYLGDGRSLRFDLDVDSAHVTTIGVGGRALSDSDGRC